VNPWLILALLAAMTAGTVLSRWYFTPANRHHAPTAGGPVTDIAACPCTPWPRLATHTVREGGRLACRSCGRIKEAAL